MSTIIEARQHVFLFRPRFIGPIQTGTKRQTIRGPRKRRVMAGDRFSLRHWEDKAYRSPQIKIASATALLPLVVELTPSRVRVAGRNWMHQVQELDGFAVSDGFRDWDDMREFWRETHGGSRFRFLGTLYPWLPTRHEDFTP